MKLNHLKNENGSVLVLVALAIVVIMGFSALGIDVGMAYLEKQKLQTAIDAASVAAAHELPYTGNFYTSAAYTTANQYIVANGFQTSDVNISPESTTKIHIEGTKNVNYLFGKVIDKISGRDYFEVKASAKAELQSVGGEAFSYAVFAGGGTASFNGSQHTFEGDIYGRDGVSLGNKANVDGKVVCTSSGSVNTGNNSNITGPVIEDSAAIAMPDFSAIIKAQGIYCTSQAEFDAAVSGKTVDGPIYVEGNLTINGRIKGTGIICASGTITADNANQANTDSICFYSATGNITFNGGTGKIYGILYAPKGTVRDNGGPNGNLHGRIIAKSVDCNGAKFSVYSNPNDLKGADTMRTVKLVD